MKFNPFLYLLLKGFFRIAVRWVECIIDTISTTPCTGSTIPVRTGKASVYGDFLYPAAKEVPDVFRVGIEPAAVAPGVGIVTACFFRKVELAGC